MFSQVKLDFACHKVNGFPWEAMKAHEVIIRVLASFEAYISYLRCDAVIYTYEGFP